MSQGLRDMLANRRFAIPLIGLLALCLIGLLMIGFVIIFQPGKSPTPVAQASGTATVAPSDTLEPTWTVRPTDSPTPRPSPTLVPVGTVATAITSQATGEVTSVVGGTATVQATATSVQQATSQATATPQPGENELAETGVGWGLVLFSGMGLALLALVARRMRLAG
jgi:hypothetical protein